MRACEINVAQFVRVAANMNQTNKSIMGLCISRKDNTSDLNLWYKFFVRQTISLGALWEHEPNRFRINLMFADKNLLVPDTSCSCRVDRWGGCNMMMPP